jgi:1-acyl-sn-glycerol-3-phosphate acyltransferase
MVSKRLERFNIRVARATLRVPWLNRVCAWCQRGPATFWVGTVVKRVLHVHGIERLGDLTEMPSAILVANHRSYFDFFVVGLVLVQNGLSHRLVFPVRSQFFYDHPVGFFVNAFMSAFSMYPPILRGEHRLGANADSVTEMIRVLRAGEACVGIHPEGQRNKNADPRDLLPMRNGVGRVAVASKAPIIPAFIYGLGNDFSKQFVDSLRGKADPIIVVFGEPIEVDDLVQSGDEPATWHAIAERCGERLVALGIEERDLRAELMAPRAALAAG